MYTVVTPITQTIIKISNTIVQLETESKTVTYIPCPRVIRITEVTTTVNLEIHDAQIT